MISALVSQHQDRLINPHHPTRHPRNKMPRRPRAARKASLQGTTAQKARKVTARRSRAARAAPTIRGVTCQRCLLRLQQFPDHVCTRSRGYNSCKHCIQVRHKCSPVSSTEPVFPVSTRMLMRIDPRGIPVSRGRSLEPHRQGIDYPDSPYSTDDSGPDSQTQSGSEGRSRGSKAPSVWQ